MSEKDNPTTVAGFTVVSHDPAKVTELLNTLDTQGLARVDAWLRAGVDGARGKGGNATSYDPELDLGALVDLHNECVLLMPDREFIGHLLDTVLDLLGPGDSGR